MEDKAPYNVGVFLFLKILFISLREREHMSGEGRKEREEESDGHSTQRMDPSAGLGPVTERLSVT